MSPKRLARIMAYARVQRAFRRDRKRCAEMFLDGTWEQDETTLTLEEQEPFWRSIFFAESEVDERPVPKAQEHWSIVDPVSYEEVAKAIADSEESAPGPDGITLSELKLISPALL